MHVLIFNGSPRKRGNSSLLIERIGEGIRAAGGDYEVVFLAGSSIRPCIGCGHCEKQGQCVFKDDMLELYDKIESSQRIVLASPVYFYSVTAQAKIFIDRCQALWSRKYLLGHTRSDRKACKGYLVSVAATSGGQIFEGAVLTTRYAFDAMDFNYSGELLIKGVDAAGAIQSHKERLAEAFALGKEICSR